MLHIKKLLFIFWMTFVSFSAFASSGGGGIGNPTSPAPNCAVNPAAGNTCATATPICDLNGYCGSTASSYTADYWSELNAAFCGSIENNSFLIFTASATSMTFNVWINSSSEGDGIQIMVFSSSGNCSGAITSYVCWSPGTATAGPTAVTATGLTPGNNYYIMIDGFAGDVCNYTIGIQSGALIPVSVASSIAGGQTICLGESATLTASGGSGSYAWDPAGVGLSALNTQSVVATPTAEGTFTYAVTSGAGSTLCPSSNTATTTVQVVNCTCSVTASNSGNVCPGGSANISSTTVPDATSYTWTGPNGFTATGQNILAINPPTTPGTYNYIVTATVPAGTCASSTSIVVYEPPTVPVSDTVVCNSTVFSETVLASVPAGATFTWTNSNPSIGLPASGSGNIPAFTATNSGNTPAQATISIVATLNGCAGPASSFVITVLPTPTVNEVSDLVQCVGSTVNEIVFSSVISNITYSWSNTEVGTGLAASGSGNIASFTAANAGVNPFVSSVTVTPSLGSCIGTTENFTITINPLPLVDAGVAQTVCANTAVTLTGAGAVSYVWNNNVQDNIPFTPTATQTYTVVGTDANGCQNSDVVEVTINPLPIVNAGQDTAICIGATVALHATVNGANFSWDNGVSDGVAFAPTTTQTYTLTAVDVNNCVSSDQVIVTVNALPTISAGSDQTVCLGTEIALNGTGGVTYDWSNNGINGQNFAPPLGVNSYTVTGTDINGCVNTDLVTITVVSVPVADFSTSATSGYPGLSVVFTNISTNSSSYLWDFGSGIPVSNNQTTIQNTYNNPGQYFVILEASNGICSDSASATITVLPFPPPVIHIPNVFTPNGDGANDNWWIDVNFASSIQVQIFNRWGNLMLEMDEFTDRWDGTIEGDNASTGVYFHKYTIVDLNGNSITGQGFLTIER